MDKHFYSALVFTVIICHGLPNSYNLFLPLKRFLEVSVPFSIAVHSQQVEILFAQKKEREKRELHRGNFLSKPSCLTVLFCTYGRFSTAPHPNQLVGDLPQSHHKELANSLNCDSPRCLFHGYSRKLIGIHWTKIANNLDNCSCPAESINKHRSLVFKDSQQFKRTNWHHFRHSANGRQT